jgi:hypothetical protein
LYFCLEKFLFLGENTTSIFRVYAGFLHGFPFHLKMEAVSSIEILAFTDYKALQSKRV